MNLKKIIYSITALLCVVATLLFAVSCGSDFDATDFNEKNDRTKRSATYASFNDEKFYGFDVDGEINMNIEIVTDSVQIFYAEIYNTKNKGTPIYKISIYNDESNTLVAEINGKDPVPVSSKHTEKITFSDSKADYVIHVAGRNHKGGYSFDW